jgi:hypothetical protein
VEPVQDILGSLPLALQSPGAQVGLQGVASRPRCTGALPHGDGLLRGALDLGEGPLGQRYRGDDREEVGYRLPGLLLSGGFYTRSGSGFGFGQLALEQQDQGGMAIC